eukprot:GEMP01010434.1.p1 GENE.GEMP01010434.1~~GEMP01010434.1.p1  ORF type:complete len:761 (+),score=209.03 GEMP01010434.1:127-2409(+)
MADRAYPASRSCSSRSGRGILPTKEHQDDAQSSSNMAPSLISSSFASGKPPSMCSFASGKDDAVHRPKSGFVGSERKLHSEEDVCCHPKSGIGGERSKLLPMDRSRLSYGGREVTEPQTKPLAPTSKAASSTLPLLTNQKKIGSGPPPAKSTVKYMEQSAPAAATSVSGGMAPTPPSQTRHSPVRRPPPSSSSSPASPSSQKNNSHQAIIPRNTKMSLVQALQSPRPSAAHKRSSAHQVRMREPSEADHVADDTVSLASSTPRSTTSTIGSQSSVSSEKWTSRGHSQSTGSTSSRRSSSNPPVDGDRQKRKRSSRSLHIGFDNCSIDLECEQKEHPGSLVLKDWSELFKDHPDRDNLIRCLKAYEMERPTKLQGHAIAAIVRGGQSSTRTKSGKSCVMIQGPSGIGKTSAVALAVIATLDPNVKHIQAIVLSGSTLRDFDKFHTVFTTLQSGENTYKSLFDNSGGHGAKLSSHVDAGTQVLCGPPRSMLHLLGHCPLCLDHIRILIIDDAHELARFNESSSPLTTTPLHDVIQVCNVLECQGAPTAHLTYVILSEGGEDQTSRKMIRLLKSSVLKKKNLLQVQDMPTKLRMHVKHYYVCAPRAEWISILAGLVKSLMFPRVIVFCDDRRQGVDYFPNKMRQLKLQVSVNNSGSQSGCMDDTRRTALQDFSSAKTQFLFTTSEPAVCQIVLPKVSCVFHLDVPSEMLSVYGVRLLPLDSQGRSDTVSVVFLEQASPKISELEKLFGICFMDMPFEFIPVNS